MGMTSDDLEKECQYCYREIDNSGLEGFRCWNRTAIKARDSSWCYPKNANEPCSICEYCEPKQNLGMTIEDSIKYLTAVKKTYTVDTEVLSIAIDTMRKYQKIEQIYEEWNKPNHFSYNNAMQAIGEVLNGDE